MNYTQREYMSEDGCYVTEYLQDGIITHTIKTPTKSEYNSDEITTETPSIEEQILTENQYQTAILEMNMMGGI